MSVEIPVSAGKLIADTYGYDQVVIVARKVGGSEHVTTYGVNKEHCAVAARMGDFFKHKLMGWAQPAAARFLLVSQDDYGFSHPEFCADEAELRQALVRCLFVFPEGKGPDDDENKEIDAQLVVLLEDGGLSFEGDPGITLHKLPPAWNGPRPRPA